MNSVRNLKSVPKSFWSGVNSMIVRALLGLVTLVWD